jgi:1-acyl-sn-glycerol-3-phosphate acyltransferase
MSLKFFRSLLFAFAFYGWTFVFALIGLPFLLLPLRFVQAFARFWVHGSLAIMRLFLGLRFKITGHVPRGPVIVASKHQSAWETVTLNLFLKNPLFLLKHELKWIPLYGFFLKRLGMISVKRHSGAGRTMRAYVQAVHSAMEQKRIVVLFPEGTRTKPGTTVPYQKGIWSFYQIGAPIVPLALNSGIFWGRRTFVKEAGCVQMIFGKPIPPGLSKEVFFEKLKDGMEALNQPSS